MIKVGITGGIGSGKSLISKVFKSLGIPVYDADSRAKALMTESSDIRNGLISTFGNDAYLSSGELNRRFLAEQVFKDELNTEKINAIVHPAVAKDFEDWYHAQNAPYIIKEAALMISSGTYKNLDKLILVSAPEELRISRTMQRDPQRSEDEVRNIISRQMKEPEMKEFADTVIDNSGEKMLLEQILKIHQELISQN